MNATVVFPVKDGKVLLGRKTKKIGVGKYNGFGGKQHGDETIEHTAARELYEETGLGLKVDNKDLELCAIVDFDNGDFVHFKVYFYIANNFTGEFKDTDEMIDIDWFDVKNMPYDNMLAADKIFVEKIFNGEKFSAKIKYNKDMSEVLSTEFGELAH